MAGERNTVGSRERVLEDGLRLWDARSRGQQREEERAPNQEQGFARGVSYSVQALTC